MSAVLWFNDFSTLGWIWLSCMCRRLMSFDGFAVSAAQSFFFWTELIQATGLDPRIYCDNIIFRRVELCEVSMIDLCSVRKTTLYWSHSCSTNESVPFNTLACKLLSKLMLPMDFVPDPRHFDMVKLAARFAASIYNFGRYSSAWTYLDP